MNELQDEGHGSICDSVSEGDSPLARAKRRIPALRPFATLRVTTERLRCQRRPTMKNPKATRALLGAWALAMMITVLLLGPRPAAAIPDYALAGRSAPPAAPFSCGDVSEVPQLECEAL